MALLSKIGLASVHKIGPHQFTLADWTIDFHAKFLESIYSRLHLDDMQTSSFVPTSILFAEAVALVLPCFCYQLKVTPGARLLTV